MQERFWQKVDRREPDECWLWTGAIQRAGYGTFRAKDKTKLAHRVAYELEVGPIPDGLTLDHLCRVRACVNPAHLDAVTMGVNVRRGNGPAGVNSRKTQCPRGHALTGSYPDGRRYCLVCKREQGRRRYA